MLYLLKLAAWLCSRDGLQLCLVGYTLSGWLTNLEMGRATNLKPNQEWVFARDFLKGRHPSPELNSDTTGLRKSCATTGVQQKTTALDESSQESFPERADAEVAQVAWWGLKLCCLYFWRDGWAHLASGISLMLKWSGPLPGFYFLPRLWAGSAVDKLPLTILFLKTRWEYWRVYEEHSHPNDILILFFLEAFRSKIRHLLIDL